MIADSPTPIYTVNGRNTRSGQTGDTGDARSAGGRRHALPRHEASESVGPHDAAEARRQVQALTDALERAAAG